MTMIGNITKAKSKFLAKTPYFYFDESKFFENITSFKNAFSKFDDLILSYSYKTNCEPCVLESVYNAGLLAEVVSPDELKKALKFNKKNNVVYNGVINDVEGKLDIIANGGYVNIDSASEYERISKLAFDKCINGKCGIRLNVKARENYTSRFGVNYLGEEWNRICKSYSKYRSIKIVGVHNHLYGCRDLALFKKRVEETCKIAKEIGAEYIDLGSGIFGIMEKGLAEQFSDIPTFDEYATVCYEVFSNYFSNFPKLIFELGTPIVADTVSLVTKVDVIKKVDNDYIATVDCSKMNLGYFPSSNKLLPYEIIHMNRGKSYVSMNIYGYICTEGDSVIRDYNGELAEGDFIVFKNCGAYCSSLTPDFIRKKIKTIKSKRLL